MIQQAIQSDRIYTVKDVAALLAVDEQTVRRWLREGAMNGSALGDRGGWRVVGADIIAFWEERTPRGKARTLPTG